MSKTKWYSTRHCEPKLRAKRRGSVAILLALALVLSLGIVAVPTINTVEASPGGPWYVSTTGSDTNDGLSWATAFRTIQHAVGVADPGDTINVAAGTYTPGTAAKLWIVIDKSLILQGEDRETTIIDGLRQISAPVLINADNVTFTGFTVMNGNDYGIFINESKPPTPIAGVQIKHNIVHDISSKSGAAISWQGFSGEIEGNEIYAGGSSGIKLAASGSDVNISIKNNLIHHNNEGIFFDKPVGKGGYSVEAKIVGNEIRNNTKGVDYSQAGKVAIQENCIYGNLEYGIINKVDTVVDATNNWWGANSGPGEAGTGSGDKVSSKVTFDPWLILDASAAPTSIPVDGLSTSTITAQFKDSEGTIPADIGNLHTMSVHFATDRGTISPNQANSDSSGRAIATLTSATTPGMATVTASAPPYTPAATDNTTVEFVAIPTVTTAAASGVTTNSATLNMSYTMGEYSSVDVRFAYKKSADTTWTETSWASKSAAGTYAEPVSGLDSGTQYDFKAELKYDSMVIEGATLQFTTSTPPPAVGGEVYPVNKVAILAPWIALAVAIIAGATIVLRRRRAQG